MQFCRELLEVIEERAQRGSTLVASQLPVDAWHAAMADSTLAEAIMDRVLRTALRAASFNTLPTASRSRVLPCASRSPTVALPAGVEGVRNQSERLSAFSRNGCPESSDYAHPLGRLARW